MRHDPQSDGSPLVSDDTRERLKAGIASGLLRDLHVVLASDATGKPFLEHYQEGIDEQWGCSLGNVTFTPGTLHDLRSVTKSVVSLLYGIAVEKGKVPPIDSPLYEQFPEYPDLLSDDARSKITIRHALTMTTGLEWDESIPYDDPANSEIAMELSNDRYRFILEQRLVAEAGEQWIYSGGNVALIGAIIERCCKIPLSKFAQQELFTPLEINSFYWAKGKDGVESAASGLRLTAPDLLKIGRLLLANGLWNGEQVLRPGWIEQSMSPAIMTPDGLGYGLLWFCGEAPARESATMQPWSAGFGNGGQRLWLMPNENIAAVIFSGRYNREDSWITPTRVWREIILRN